MARNNISYHLQNCNSLHILGDTCMHTMDITPVLTTTKIHNNELSIPRTVRATATTVITTTEVVSSPAHDISDPLQPVTTIEGITNT
jgi:hypothetical protein